jgi:hypothetical protein
MTYLPISLPRHLAQPQSPAELARLEQAYYENNAGAEWHMPPRVKRVLAELLQALEDALRQSGHGIRGRRTAIKTTCP